MSTRSYKGKKFQDGKFHSVDDVLAVEESLKITLNGSPYTVTMRSPGNEKELVRGLLFSENVYTDIQSDLVAEVKEKNPSGIITWMDVAIPPDKIGKGFESVRSIMSVSSCGICGKTELDTFNQQAKPLKTSLDSLPRRQAGARDDISQGDHERLEPRLITGMFEQMSSNQDTFRHSGGSHAAAAFTFDGKFLSVMEDIGRHNAVDKVIGDLLLKKQLQQAKCMTVSGRASYEIVNKCFSAGIPFLAAVSAPSSLAVDLADQLGITLMGFCRDKKFTVYSHAERIK